jgi:S-DNA-T family DNA segregation ATPase FtsK/SpoIIIE
MILNYFRNLIERYNAHVLKNQLIQAVEECFKLGDIYKKYGESIVYPNIVRVGANETGLEVVIDLPRGFNPEDVSKKAWVFEQEFGQDTELKRVSAKTFILYLMTSNPFKETLLYNYENIYSEIAKYDLPIFVGKTARGGSLAYDMVEQPHLLIAGETGSGKSVLLRSVITTHLLSKSPNELQMYLFDMKKSEFFLFKQMPHVRLVTHEISKIKACFIEIKKEMSLRGDLLEQYEVSHVTKLPKEVRPPFIVVCIDEFSLLSSEKDILNTLNNVAAIGRALGIFVILSTQRPSAKILEGEIKVNLTVRIGGRTQDAVNSRIIIDSDGCENLSAPGHMKAKTSNGLTDVKVPYLDEEAAKSLLEPFKLLKEVEVTEREETPKKPAKRVSTRKVKKSKVIVWGDFK